MSFRSFYVAVVLMSFSALGGSAEVTYSRDVAPILYQHCTVCHHPNDIAPMSLMDYKSAPIVFVPFKIKTIRPLTFGLMRRIDQQLSSIDVRSVLSAGVFAFENNPGD